jgi:hypothetical protein
MTAYHFEEWFKDKLLPNLLRNILIVMDNASSHSCRIKPLPIESYDKKRNGLMAKEFNILYLQCHTMRKAQLSLWTQPLSLSR